ncbi:hypothetical protein BD769DRAFT_1390932 [Suillus cothurnatus]|nr:hypothetical protein BD769DRAFT_1390932 [Suillus cothurnatus]
MSLDRETYPRLYNALATPDTVLELDDVADDVAVEQETLTSGSPEVPANSSASTGITDGLSSLQETLKHVLKGILDSTESEYKRCDSVKLDGTNKPSTDERGSYGHAQKLWAAMTYAFGHLQGLGNLPWHESELQSGQMLGNPLVSVEVSSYVQAGEVAVSAHAITSVSARAITSHILERMYHFNHCPENWAILDYQPGERGDGSNIKPFWLWIMPMEGYLCAIQAIAEWITASRITTGYLF